jgi:hypothetical protein
MPLPVAHGLIGATIVAASREDISLSKDWQAMMLGASLAVIPDFDLILSWVLGYSIKYHGGFTHSILFSLAAGLLACWLMRERNLRAFLIYSSASVSHSLLDVMTKKDFGGAELLWPLSSHKFKLGLMDYFEFYPSPTTDPIGPILDRALEICNYEVMLFMPLLIVVVWWKRWQDRIRVRSRAGARPHSLSYPTGAMKG